MTRLDRASNAFSQQTRFELPLNSITVNNLKTAKQRYRPKTKKKKKALHFNFSY